MKDMRIILIDTGSDANRIMMSDVGKMNSALQISDLYHLDNHILLEKIFRIHFGFKLNSECNIPLKHVWDRRCVLNQLLIDEKQDYYLIFVNDVIRKFSDKYLKKLNSMKNVHTYVLLLDSYAYIQSYFRRCLDKVRPEHVYSFQNSDCVKHGYRYVNTLYSKVDENTLTYGTKADIYFVGAEKDRMVDIYNLYKMFSSFGYKCNFIVIIKPSKLSKYKIKYSGINFKTKRVNYLDILTDIKSSKCILELCQSGQDGLTMRFYEAIFYNKYLITNNASAQEHKLFNNNYMYVFDTMEDIENSILDISRKVDYYYQNEMSPVHLVNEIIQKNDYRGFLK